MRRLNAGTRNPDPVSPGEPEADAMKFKKNPTIRSGSFSKHTSKSSSSSLKLNLLAVSVVAVVLSIVFCLLFVRFGYSSSENGPKFGIIIDGGSTGTRIHVFKYAIEGETPRFDFGADGLKSLRVTPGLSSFADDPEEAGGSLLELLEFAKVRVPQQLWGETEIRLMATAGLRLLDLKFQDSILESCRRMLSSSGFRFHEDWASVITGSDEGLYAWVVANYALGSLGGDPMQTTGIIELGGASVQVTFAPSEKLPSEFSRNFKYGNITYTLYSHSLLHLGQNVAFDALKDSIVSGVLLSASSDPIEDLVTDPCTPKGYPHDDPAQNFSPSPSAHKYASTFRASGNFSDCRSAALMLLQQRKEECAYHRCSVGSTFIPKIDGKFLATENFFHTSKFLGFAPELLLSDLVEAGKKFCEDDWSSIRKNHPSADHEDLLPICFSAAYIVAFLHDSLGISLDDEGIKYTNRVENVPLDWALGAFILQTTTAATTTTASGGNISINHPEWVPSFHGEELSNLLFILFASCILVSVGWCFSKWKKPCLKTIYDLEKGRYIVTRIGDRPIGKNTKLGSGVVRSPGQ